MSAFGDLSEHQHPFWPASLELPNYYANDMRLLDMLGRLSVTATLVLGVAYIAARRINPSLNTGDLSSVIWFTLCGSLHVLFEGYYVVNHHHMPEMKDTVGQLWKEYSLSDSRYLSQDTLVVCMESMTVLIWGPLSFLMVYLVISRSPFRHPIQALVSTGHLYGDALYYATSLYDHVFKNITYCRPEGYYFWVYYFLMNFFWILVPSVLLYNSISITAEAIALHNLSIEGRKQK